jgi:hypothetical protein
VKKQRCHPGRITDSHCAGANGKVGWTAVTASLRFRRCELRQSIKRRSPCIDLPQLTVPPLHVRKLRQWQTRTLRERQRRCDSKIGVGEMIADEPRPAVELGVKNGRMTPEVAKRRL